MKLVRCRKFVKPPATIEGGDGAVMELNFGSRLLASRITVGVVLNCTFWAGLWWCVGATWAVDVPVPSSSAFSPSWDKVRFSHSLWGEVLTAHVGDDGLVDYASLGQDERFREYLFRLARTDPRGLVSADARLAYWLNAYNAFAIKGVLETRPIDPDEWTQYSVLSVKVSGVLLPGKGFFVGLKFEAGGERYSLDQIEKAILLGKVGLFDGRGELYKAVGPGGPDARIHMALVCAARGCPKLSREAFEGSRVHQQLDALVGAFTRDSERCRFDLERKVLKVSKLVRWYGDDFSNPAFNPHARSVTDFFARFVGDERLAASLRKDRWKLSYLSYDWGVNARR